jgi:hypothetical protein
MTIRRKQPGPDGSMTRVVNCGRCGPCLRKKQIDWCFRLGKELNASTTACFLTLTYSDENIPIADGGYSLLRTDFQKFMKRLRKHASTGNKNAPKLKYYAVGEYGSKTERPHYHAIVFNLPRPFEKFVSKAWKLGHIHIGTVTEASIFYTTKYALKGLKRRKADEVDIYGREPQFALMSNGLGESYINDTIVDYLRTQGTKLLTLPGGSKKKLPRYYIEKMFPDPEEKMLWRAAANAEIVGNIHDLEITDKQREELIHLFEYRNKQKLGTDKI